MLAALEDILDRSVREDRYIGDGDAVRLRAEVQALPDDAPTQQKWNLYFKLGKAELVLGNEQAAIAALSHSHGLNDTLSGVVPPEAAQQLTFELGVAYLRMAETQNCCARNSPDSCILPIRGDGIHTNRTGSLRAIECFSEVLANTKRLSLLNLKACWLLNLASMTLGEYPDGVPEKHRIPPTILESDEAFPKFANIAQRVGLDTFSLCGGAISDDFDGDGHLDLAVSSYDPAGQLRFFRNNSDGSFEDRTRAAGLEGIFGGLNLVQADYNNDGHVDILVLRGAWHFDKGRHPNSLLRNNGDGTFTDVTFDAGLGDAHYPTQTASWADYDNDGDLDLYIGNETTPAIQAPSQLFRNNGDSTFTDVAVAAGVTNDRFSKAVIWGDYDADRFPDIYVSNLRGENRLFHNNRDGTFSDVAPELGLTGPRISFPAWFWDFDNDGHLDIYVASYNASGANIAAEHLGLLSDAERASLYRGNGKTFKDVAVQSGLGRANFPMGANFGDLDNDGYLDFYLGTGDIRYSAVAPNVMYRNKAGQRFADVTMAGGFGHLQKGHAIVFADLDNDGDQDVFEQMGGAFLGDKFHDALFENPGFGNHWISVLLTGIRSNRSAIGARIRIDVVIGGQQGQIYRHVNSGGSFGANPLRQAIGLGQAERIAQLQVFWPTTGKTQTFRDLPLDRYVEIVEGQENFSVKELKAFRLGGP